MKKISICSLLLLVVIYACRQGKPAEEDEDEMQLLTTAKTFFQPISSLGIEPPNPDLVTLGKHLYFDTRLSGIGNISCNSCHDLNKFGVDNEQFSLGDAGDRGGRNSPTVFHAALHTMQFWDGRAVDVEEQAAGPILNPIEHNIKNEQELVGRLKKVPLYEEMFSKAYQSDSDPITFDNVTKAIGAFERTLMPESRFDKYLEGDTKALSAQEKKGLNAFIDVGCITCHSGPALGGQMLQKFGLFEDYWKHTNSEKVDLGLFDISQNEAEKYFFKVPGLRNVAETWPYFHDGSVRDLTQAVRIMGKLQRNVDLSEEQVDDIVVFLGSLTSDIPEEVKKSPFETK